MDDEHYFSRRVSVVVPLGEDVREFIITGKDEVGVLSKITSVMARHKANLIKGGTYDAIKKEEFVFNVFAEMSGSDCTADELAAELRKFSFVTAVVTSATEEAVYDQHLFPVTLFEDYRAVIVTAESIAFMERDLQKQLGSQGLQFLFEAGRSSALGLAVLHKNMLPEADRESLLKTSIDDMRARGWGIANIVVPKASGGKIKVTVKEPVFAGIPGVKSSWWLMGLAAGFLEAVYGRRTVVSGKTTFSSETRVFSFELVEFREDSRSNRELA